MLACLSVKRRFALCIALIGVTVGTLSASSLVGIYTYRDLVRTVSFRAQELPLAHDLLKSITALSEICQRRASLIRSPECFGAGYEDATRFAESTGHHESSTEAGPQDADSAIKTRLEFQSRKLAFDSALEAYQKQLEQVEPGTGISDKRSELQTLERIAKCRARLERLYESSNWLQNDSHLQSLAAEVDELKLLAERLPKNLQNNMLLLKHNAQGQYRTLIGLTIGFTFLAAVMIAVFGKIFFDGVLAPLRTLIRGSRRVARGDFHHRIVLTTRDELAELAAAMNDMTNRFCEVRDDLDRQVRERTREVVLSEKMASVGFLAAGIAHEINNPLQAIAMCSESLESRLQDIIAADDVKPDDEHNQEITILRKYLRRIQDEAFRCKGITDKLLSYSRMGDAEKQSTDLAPLLADVIELVRAVRNYRSKHIEFARTGPVLARVVPHEIKQVALNLLTNALDSIDADGAVRLELNQLPDQVEVVVSDNGCGMTEEVKKHLFEPFFTRRRDGQGTGLGLSIIYRIIQDHGGSIHATSPGPGQGSTFRILLPRNLHEERREKQQAA